MGCRPECLQLLGGIDRARRRGRHTERISHRLVDHRFSLLEMDRGEAKHLAEVVKSVTDVVFGQLVGKRRVGAKQIPQDVCPNARRLIRRSGTNPGSSQRSVTPAPGVMAPASTPPDGAPASVKGSGAGREQASVVTSEAARSREGVFMRGVCHKSGNPGTSRHARQRQQSHLWRAPSPQRRTPMHAVPRLT